MTSKPLFRVLSPATGTDAQAEAPIQIWFNDQPLSVPGGRSVAAALLAAGVQVAEPQLDPGHLGDDALVNGGHPVAGRVVPVDPEQLAADDLVGVLGDDLDQRDRVDPEFAARAGSEQQLTCGGVNIPDVNHDRISGEDGHRGGSFLGFNPANSDAARKRLGQEIRHWLVHLRSDQTLTALAQRINAEVRGWIN